MHYLYLELAWWLQVNKIRRIVIDTSFSNIDISIFPFQYCNLLWYFNNRTDHIFTISTCHFWAPLVISHIVPEFGCVKIVWSVKNVRFLSWESMWCEIIICIMAAARCITLFLAKLLSRGTENYINVWEFFNSWYRKNGDISITPHQWHS